VDDERLWDGLMAMGPEAARWDIISLEMKVVALGLRTANQRGVAARHHDMGETTSQVPTTEYDEKHKPGGTREQQEIQPALRRYSWYGVGCLGPIGRASSLGPDPGPLLSLAWPSDYNGPLNCGAYTENTTYSTQMMP
jgi:hypothetical protein